MSTQPQLGAAMPLRPYQKRWVLDEARFKLAVKSARIGFSFATALEAVLDCLKHAKATWTVLSASKAQSVEFVETCRSHLQLMGEVAQLYDDEKFVDLVEGTEDYQMRIAFPNGSRIIALPANPRTARGYPGNAILDEFAHHEKSYAIWAAVIRQTALGHKLRALSTPNGEQGKFFDLAREFGLTDEQVGQRGVAFAVQKGPWSAHYIDVYGAVEEGCPINIDEMRAGVGDEDTWQQEFCCAFLKAAGAWLPLELIATCEDAGATVAMPPGYGPTLRSGNPELGTEIYGPPTAAFRGYVSAGIDVARDHDATCFWLDEKIGDVLWTRHVLWLHGKSFPAQFRLLAPLVALCDRVAIDATGMGIALYDMLNEAYPGRIIGINFAGTRPRGEKPLASSIREDGEKSIRMKVDLAIRLKKQLEMNRLRLPPSQQVRNELASIKRESTGGGVRFEAPRIEVDSAVAGGSKTKRYAHADAFWAAALAAYAAETTAISTDITTSAIASNYAASGGIL